MADDTLRLSDYLTDDEIHTTVDGLSANLARTRHKDYDEMVQLFEPTDDQLAEIYSGQVDPAEQRYRMAKDSMSLDAILGSDYVSPSAMDTNKSCDDFQSAVGLDKAPVESYTLDNVLED